MADHEGCADTFSIAVRAPSFYFPGVLVGPSTRFVDYRAWANGTIYSSPKGKER